MAADPVLQGVDVQPAEDAIALGTLVSNAARGAPIGKRFGPGMQTRAGQANFAPVAFDKSDLDGPGQAERLELTGKLLHVARSGGGKPGDGVEYCAVVKPGLFELGHDATVLRDGLMFHQNGAGGIESAFEWDFSAGNQWAASIRLGCRRPGCETRSCTRCVYLYQVFFPTLTPREHTRRGCECGRSTDSKKAASCWRARKSRHSQLVQQLPDDWVRRVSCGVIVSLQVMRLGPHSTRPAAVSPYSNILTSPSVAEVFRSATDWKSTQSRGRKMIEAARAALDIREDCVDNLRSELNDLFKGVGRDGWARVGVELGVEADLAANVAVMMGEIVAARQSLRDGRFSLSAHRMETLIALENPLMVLKNTVDGMVEVGDWVKEQGGDFVYRPPEYRVLTEEDVRPGKGSARRETEGSIQAEVFEMAADLVGKVYGVSGEEAKGLGWMSTQRQQQEGPVAALYRSGREKLKQNFDAAEDILSVAKARKEELSAVSGHGTMLSRRQTAQRKEAEARALARSKAEGRNVQIQSSHAFVMLEEGMELVNDLGLGDVVIVDGTHRTNSLGWELWTVMVLNEAGKGVPVMHAWLEQSGAADYLEALQFYLARTQRKPSVVVMDMDFSQLLAALIALPHCRVRFCGFHFVQAVVRKFRKKDHPMVDALRALQHAPTREVFQERLKTITSALMSESEKEDWAAEPKTRAGQEARVAHLVHLDAMTGDADAELVREGVGGGGAFGETAQDLELDRRATRSGEQEEPGEEAWQDEERAAADFRDPRAASARLKEALAGIKAVSLDQRKIMFQYLIHILGTRRHWSKAWWVIQLYITTSNWIESYHRVLKHDYGVGSGTVVVPLSVLSVLHSDLDLFERRRRACVEELEFLANLILKHPAIPQPVKDVLVHVAGKDSYVGQLGSGLRAIRGTGNMDTEFSERVLCHPLVLTAIMNNASKDHVVALIGSISRHQSLSSPLSVECVSRSESLNVFRVSEFYTVTLGPDADARLCSCPAFAQRGIVCKHIVAAFEAEVEEILGVQDERRLGADTAVVLERSLQAADASLPDPYWLGKSITIEYAMRTDIAIRRKERAHFLSLSSSSWSSPGPSTGPPPSVPSRPAHRSTRSTRDSSLRQDLPHARPVPMEISSTTTTSTATLTPSQAPPALSSPLASSRSHRSSSPPPPSDLERFLPITPSRTPSISHRDQLDLDRALGLSEDLRKSILKLVPALQTHGVSSVSEGQRDRLEHALSGAIGAINNVLTSYQDKDVPNTNCKGQLVSLGGKRKRGSVSARKPLGATRSARYKSSETSSKRKKLLDMGADAFLAAARQKGTGRVTKAQLQVSAPLSFLHKKNDQKKS